MIFFKSDQFFFEIVLVEGAIVWVPEDFVVFEFFLQQVSDLLRIQLPLLKQLSCILSQNGLTQHIHEPTHVKGHWLDMVACTGQLVNDVVVSDAQLSDHYAISFRLNHHQ